MKKDKLNFIVESLRENDKKLDKLFKEREGLVKDLTDYEYKEVWVELMSDGKGHYDF